MIPTILHRRVIALAVHATGHTRVCVYVLLQLMSLSTAGDTVRCNSRSIRLITLVK